MGVFGWCIRSSRDFSFENNAGEAIGHSKKGVAFLINVWF